MFSLKFAVMHAQNRAYLLYVAFRALRSILYVCLALTKEQGDDRLADQRLGPFSELLGRKSDFPLLSYLLL